MRIYIPVSFFFILFFLVTGIHAQLRLEPPHIDGFHPLDAEPPAVSPLNYRTPAILTLQTTLFSDTALIDFEKRQITFRKMDPLGFTMWEFHYGELSDYLASRRNFSLYTSWKRELGPLQASSEAEKRKSMKLEWELPMQYPSWAQRVLGKEPPKLKIDGFLEILMGYQNTDYDQGGGIKKYVDNNEFKFDINYSFGLSGSIGRLINVNIRADKEQDLDISDNLKRMKIEYKEVTPGELEDEIIQEAIIGYTGFSMPGTNLSGYSESKEGLFGIKVRAKVGPLELTGIASTEQGQSNKKTYSSGAGGSSGAQSRDAKDFLVDRYFFLDNQYRKLYIKKYAPGSSGKVSAPKVTSLSVWRNYSGTYTENISNIKKVRLDTTAQYYKFERLERDVHYYLNDVEGYIRLADSITLRTEQQIAIYLRTEDPTLSKGAVQLADANDSANGISAGDTIFTLWELRPKEPIDSLEQDTARYNLMWRNAYGPADYGDKTSFKLAIKRIDEDFDEKIEMFENGSFYADTMGLSEKNVPKIQSTYIYNTLFGDLILPPFDTSDNALEPFNNPALGKYCDPIIYKYGEKHPKRTTDYKTIWTIEMSGKKKQTTFDDLGWDIMEGTELVKADGVTLERDRDYTISYSDGVIDLTSARAKAADKIEIEYQSGALFVPERKMFLGTHGKIELPFISDKSYAGASILFQSTSSNDDIPRLDQEPFSKMLFDINTHIEFQPEWMTDLVKKIPLVQTDAQSSVSLDLELAHSRVNPNKSGSAYIDDFEDCKETDALGNDDDAWHRASPPVSRDSLYYYPPAWESFWFTPVRNDDLNSIKRNDIIELTDAEKKLLQTGSDYETVLRLHAIPAPSAAYTDRYRKTWAGIMKPISQSFADKRLMQYFEMFIKAEGGFQRKGKLLVQMGVMREDLSLDGREPNLQEDREDTSQIIRKESYQEALDLGGDKLPDSSEVYWVPSETAGQWEGFGYGDKRLGADSLDPSRDNFKEYNTDGNNKANYRYACRTQLDGSIEFSEDINYDGVVQTTTIEKYFQFTIDLGDTGCPFIDKSAKMNPTGGWRKYIIPLRERLPGTDSLCDTINNPSWSNITMVRLIWMDFDSLAMTKEQSLVFNNLSFVGNKWIEVADSGSSKIKPSVVNTKEDSLYEPMITMYDHLINRERDQYGYEIEQSLRLTFSNLVNGDTALVRRSLEYQTLNLSAYQTLSLLVYGQHPDKRTNSSRNDDLLYNGDVKFIFRFGTDDSTYYEYRTPIKAQWNNQININLKEISDLKDQYLVAHRDSAIEISNGTLRIRAPASRQPNFSRIRWMALGVIRDGSESSDDSISGEIWVNEMKLSGIKNLVGSASRAELVTKWADLISLQAKMEYENGNFRRMTETENLPDNTKVDGSIGASIALDKFLPPSLGISIPAGVSFNTSLTRPQLKNETDVYLVDDKGNPDGFLNTVSDAAKYMVGMEDGGTITRSEEYQTLSMGRTYYTSYKKSNRSDNPIISLLSDRWSADVKYGRTIAETRYGKNAVGDSLYARSDTSHSYSGRVQYDLTPHDPPKWTKWSPFKSVEQKWLPSQMKNYELTFLPRKFTIDVADISYGKQHQVDTWRRVESQQYTYTVRHNTAIDYSPLSPICDLNYSLGINRDLIGVAKEDTRTMGKTIFKRNNEWEDYMVLWGEKDRTQRMSINCDPRFFDWLTTSSTYSSDYNATVVSYLSRPEPYLNTGVKSSFSLNGSFDLDRLLGQLKTATEKNVFGGFFDMAKKGLGEIGLQQLSCTYTANSDLKNNYVSTGLLRDQSVNGIKDMLLYQMGIKGRSFWDIVTGEMDDQRFLGLQSRKVYDSATTDFYTNDSRIVDRSLRLSSSLNLKRLDLSFRQMSMNYSVNYNLHPDTTRNDTTITFPDFSIGVRTGALNKIAVVKQNIQNVDLNSTFSYRQSDRKTSQVGGSTRSIKIDFMPLLSFSGTMKKWPIRFDYRHNYSTETNVAFTIQGEPPDTNKDVTLHTDEFTLNYEFEKGGGLNEIKLLTWTIPVKGRTSVGMKFNRSSEVERITDRNNKSYSLVPNLSYIFTDNVTGRAEYKFEKSDDGGEKTTTNDFSCTVQIRF